MTKQDLQQQFDNLRVLRVVVQFCATARSLPWRGRSHERQPTKAGNFGYARTPSATFSSGSSPRVDPAKLYLRSGQGARPQTRTSGTGEAQHPLQAVLGSANATSLLYFARFTAKAQTKDDHIGLAPIRQTRRNVVSSNGMMGLPDPRMLVRRTRELQDLVQPGMRATSVANQVILRMSVQMVPREVGPKRRRVLQMVLVIGCVISAGRMGISQITVQTAMAVVQVEVLVGLRALRAQVARLESASNAGRLATGPATVQTRIRNRPGVVQLLGPPGHAAEPKGEGEDRGLEAGGNEVISNQPKKMTIASPSMKPVWDAQVDVH